jgi:amino acid adenylation domain-containing protein
MSDRASTLTELFARSAARFDAHTAVSDDTRALSYRELDEQSAAMAARLREHGLGQEDRVCLFLRRSVDVVVSILGVLRAGGAYVAIDLRYPPARRELMLRASGATVVIAHGEEAEEVPATEVPVLIYDDLDLGCGAPIDQARADGAASILFTSGSSGEPKGIVLEHRNIVSFADNSGLPRLTDRDRVGQISSIAFDAFHFELWSSLAAGAQIVVLPPVPDLLAADFQRELRRYRISAMLVPTMVANHVVREDIDAFSALRILQVGGDVILPVTCQDIFDSDFSGDLYNLYGPAESTTACTAHRVLPEDAKGDTIPIGHPLDGVTVLLLDTDLSPVAPGEVGEIFVGGPGFARGYLDQPDVTDSRFVPNPLAAEPARLYRTGDLARERTDGALEFLGRADGQVKIRGYRVEPGEVERVLRRHPDVYDAMLLATGEGEDKGLVAFVVLDGRATALDVRKYAQAELPEFMVPSRVVLVDEIGSTDHGKRDVDSLLAILAEERERERRHVAPDTSTEQYLARLWEELLGVERIGANEDFFVLGGHSLQAHRMQRRLRQDLGIALDHKTIFRYSGLAVLASVIDGMGEDAAQG